ncbi:Uncharacterised protein [Mycobacterium tuberculosis]|nr:Uncharacterised protein [Mycobacterium tuberculosis]
MPVVILAAVGLILYFLFGSRVTGCIFRLGAVLIIAFVIFLWWALVMIGQTPPPK